MVLVGVFFLLRFLIGNDADALADRLVALHPAGPIGIVRPEFKAYEPPTVVEATTQLERIRAALADEIKQLVKSRIALYKYPRWIEFVPSLPKNDRGKVDRKLLKQHS